jgi:hypothetical protein
MANEAEAAVICAARVFMETRNNPKATIGETEDAYFYLERALKRLAFSLETFGEKAALDGR